MRHCRIDPSRGQRQRRARDDRDAAVAEASRARTPPASPSTATAQPSELVMRFKVAEQEDMRRASTSIGEIQERRAEVDRRLEELGATHHRSRGGDRVRLPLPPRLCRRPAPLADYIEDVEGAEILSLGHALELIKDLGDASTVAGEYQLDELHRHPRHRARPHGDRIRRRYPLGPPLLGLSFQRHLGRSQRPAHQLLDLCAARSSGAAIASCRTAIPS